MNFELKSGFHELAMMTKRTEADLAIFTWETSSHEKHSFASEQAALEYIQQMDNARKQHATSDLSDDNGIIDVSKLFEDLEQDAHLMPQIKKRKKGGSTFVCLFISIA